MATEETPRYCHHPDCDGTLVPAGFKIKMDLPSAILTLHLDKPMVEAFACYEHLGYMTVIYMTRTMLRWVLVEYIGGEGAPYAVGT